MQKQRLSDRKTGRARRSFCPVSNTLDILGDKWTLLVVRDLFLGKRTYSEFVDSPEGIPTNILADRLKRLEQEAIIERQPYQEHPRRYTYHLTEKGKALGPMMKAMVAWGLKYVHGSYTMDAETFIRRAKRRVGVS